MKKCPECGNPSYDGAPICGNCGYKFPKPRMVPPKREDIFQNEVKVEKPSNNKSTLDIIKEKKLIIGAILLLTIIVICGIFLLGPNNNTNSPQIQSNGLTEFSEGGFSFMYPESWEEVNLTDSEHDGAKFFKTSDNTTVEYYQVTSDFASLKEVTQNRISYAQENEDYVDLIETIKLNNIESSNVILESTNGDFTRFVSIFGNNGLNVFKITGNSLESVTSEDINSMLNSIKIA